MQAFLDSSYFRPLVETAVILIVGLFLLRWAERGAAALARRLHFPPLAARPVSFLVRWIGLLVGLSLILSLFGVNLLTILSAVLTLIGIGFVAVWSVLSNISCTFLLIGFRVFRVGDEIEFPGEPVKGRVTEMNLLYTTLRAEDGALLQVPNNLFLQKVLRRVEGKGEVELGQSLPTAAAKR